MSGLGTGEAPERTEFEGAVYGSLLAASVVAGSAVDDRPLPAGDLVAVLISTGVVFWLAHLYAHVISHGPRPLSWRRLWAAGRREWPLAQAAFPPSVAAALASGLGASDAAASWIAMAVAIADQVSWSVAAAIRSRAGIGVVLLSGAANLILGLAIIALKTLLEAH
ncbi:hypothetical protein [Bailinhaonella thermotolerans]|uniref:Integral membrane protein n=1 Tax=Bailinhaonella thermotolerans TaxID=1070861 RepID=A0A3A4AMB9_9ACTN|nr:hypothetical protein [Bailinhaonella thermotolerans]RJL30101.1 hypothetical protein D5H75_24580 [Bailinhaonella thermotolerans]